MNIYTYFNGKYDYSVYYDDTEDYNGFYGHVVALGSEAYVFWLQDDVWYYKHIIVAEMKGAIS